MRHILILTMALLVSACAGTAVKIPLPSEPPPQVEPADPAPAAQPEAPPPPPPAPPPRRNVTLAAVGDIMLGTDYPAPRLPPQDGDTLLRDAAPTLLAADIAFGNLEGVLLDGGEALKICNDPTRCYVFRTPARYVRHLLDAGFDVVSVANNHARDFGEEGRSETMRVLAEVGIRHSGREGDIASWRVRDSTVALIAFAPNPGSHSLLDIPGASTRVSALAATHDIVIVSFHGGAEGADARNVSEGMETFLGEQRGDLIAFSHAVIDAGADIVIGHGPHVPRAMEIYQGRLIAYSLGNFTTYFGISVAGDKGLAPILRATMDADGAFLEGDIVSMRQRRPDGPKMDPTGEAARLIQRLSESDRGDAAPVFAADGSFRARGVPRH